MTPNAERLKYLFQRFLNDSTTPDETRELWDMISHLEDENPIKDTLRQLWDTAEPLTQTVNKDWNAAQQRINELLKPERKAPVLSIFGKKWIAAAAVLILLTAGAIFVFNRDQLKNTGGSISGMQHQIVPGSDKAVLTLDDGSIIILDSTGNAIIAQKGVSGSIKQINGELVYDPMEGLSAVNASVQYNTVNIPKGGQYRLTLSDGTQVWLNSETRITFPIHFYGDQRTVELNGEAYFEVKPNIKPFIVKTSGVDVNVLGTKFNVSAYNDDDAVVTTLTEGKVRVQNQHNTMYSIITPGEQNLYNRNNKIQKTNKVDTHLYTSWKDGKFYFKKEKLGSIMKKLSRWYDITIEFRDPVVANKIFTGVALRNRSIEDLLNMINLTTEIKYKVEGNTLIILSN